MTISGSEVRAVYRLGTHRAISPDETFARARALFGRAGITRIANVTGLDRIGIPVVMAVRPNSRSLAVSQGKGLTLAAAKASAAMESLEGWHAENVHTPLRYASFADLVRTQPAIDVERMVRPKTSIFRVHLPLLWIEGRDLLAGSPAWVPFEAVSTDYTTNRIPGAGSFAATTNGLASGNTVDEAIVHAVAEIIERDAITCFAIRPAARHPRRMALDSVDDAECRALLARFQSASIFAAVFDLTTDLAVPVFAARIEDPETRRVAWGYGCHPSRGIALVRALTEAAQTRLTAISGARDDLERAHAYRRPLAAAILPEPNVRFSDVPTFDNDTIEGDRDVLLGRLRAVGISSAVAIDLSLPEHALAVVRVVVPGLENALEGHASAFALGTRAERSAA